MLDRYDQDLLLDYLEGELDADRRAQLDALLAEDAQLASLLEAMAQDREVLRSLPREGMPGDLAGMAQEMAQDVTQTLERRMLLDDPVDTGPIPIGRGRGLPTEPARGGGLGRIAGLVGLAASVAIAAGVVVFLVPDPLERTANSLADNDNAVAPDGADGADDTAGIEGLQPGADAAAEGAIVGRAPAAEALARGSQPPVAGTTSTADALGTPAAPTGPDRIARTPETDLDTLRGGAGLPLAAGDFGWGRGDDFNDLADTPTINTVALANAMPTQQLVLFTEEPELTQEQLVAWCIFNGIPIVEADVAAADSEGLAHDPTTEPGFGADAPARKTPDNGYALLINNRQLDALVNDLNSSVNIDTTQAGQRAAVSNQMALLADLPGKDEAEAARQRYSVARDEAALEEDADAVPAQTDRLEAEPDEQAGQYAAKTIELRLPKDLGSPYANTLNRDNLDYEQRRNNTNYRNAYTSNKTDSTQYGQVANREALLQKQFNNAQADATPQDNASLQPPADGPKLGKTVGGEEKTGAGQLAEQLALADSAEQKPQAKPELKPADEPEKLARNIESDAQGDGRGIAPASPAEPAPTPEAEPAPETAPHPAPQVRAEPQPATPRPALSPTRGNWLAPHLPLTDTTLILNLPHDASAEPTQLVPIAIKRAPADKVRSLKAQYPVAGKLEEIEAQLAADKDAEEPADAEPGDAASEAEANEGAQE